LRKLAAALALVTLAMKGDKATSQEKSQVLEVAKEAEDETAVASASPPDGQTQVETLQRSAAARVDTGAVLRSEARL